MISPSDRALAVELIIEEALEKYLNELKNS